MIARLGRRGFVGGAAAVSAALWLPRTVQAAQAMGFDDARHLLWRTSFGATPAEIEALASIDYATAVDRLLTKTHPQALTAAPAWVNEGPASLRQRQQNLSQPGRHLSGVHEQVVQFVGCVTTKRPFHRHARRWLPHGVFLGDEGLAQATAQGEANCRHDHRHAGKNAALHGKALAEYRQQTREPRATLGPLLGLEANQRLGAHSHARRRRRA